MLSSDEIDVFVAFLEMALVLEVIFCSGSYVAPFTLEDTPFEEEPKSAVESIYTVMWPQIVPVIRLSCTYMRASYSRTCKTSNNISMLAASWAYVNIRLSTHGVAMTLFTKLFSGKF
jgi:hypothetical protein